MVVKNMKIKVKISLPCQVDKVTSGKEDFNSIIWSHLPPKFSKSVEWYDSSHSLKFYVETPQSAEDWGTFGFWMNLCIEPYYVNEFLGRANYDDYPNAASIQQKIRENSFIQHLLVSAVNYAVDQINSCLSNVDLSDTICKGFKVENVDNGIVQEVLDADWQEC